MISWLKRKLLYKRHRAFVELFDIRQQQAFVVMSYFKDFCKVDKVFSNDPLEMARNVGRREVFDEINKYLSFTNEQISMLREEVREEV